MVVRVGLIAEVREVFQKLKIAVIFQADRMIRRDSGFPSNNTTWYEAVFFYLETNIIYKPSANGAVIFIWPGINKIYIILRRVVFCYWVVKNHKSQICFCLFR
jgi:hypothetical protein